MREPRLGDLVEFICHAQPELDTLAATRIIQEDDEYRDWITQQWHAERQFRTALLEHHLLLDEKRQLTRQNGGGA